MNKWCFGSFNLNAHKLLYETVLRDSLSHTYCENISFLFEVVYCEIFSHKSNS